MRTRGFPVMIEVEGARIDAGFRAPSTEKPVLIALLLRDRGWDPYRVAFDPHSGAWIARAFPAPAQDQNAHGETQ
jgi:hypothetical protein